ncbi:Eukaryotic-type carbonic anhydrase [Phytophthora infestans]|uniref:carbonic anhydrase n=1 Tax=Phytophthora infestans TaxID=4787 RepID=A0A8S9TPL2_PHYIN|nr:Eukaryotic-type carbonic anhydrase [Phytophthora infestans]
MKLFAAVAIAACALTATNVAAAGEGPWGYKANDTSMASPDRWSEATVDGGSCTATANGASYNMLQFHMHVPSEHTLNGQYLGGEVHFVHSNADSSALLVTGVFLRLCKDANVTASATLAPYSDLVNKTADAQGVFNYAGSLTTPGCTEIVDWWVVKKPVDVSTGDLERLQSQLRKLRMTDDGRRKERSSGAAFEWQNCEGTAVDEHVVFVIFS